MPSQLAIIAAILIASFLLTVFLTHFYPQNYSTIQRTIGGIASTSQPTILFSDDFESYTLSSLPSSGQCINSQYVGGGDTAATAATMTGCNAPPNINIASYPHYWQPASSGACTGGKTSVTNCQYNGIQCDGGCVCWSTACQMGPNSIFAIVDPSKENPGVTATSGNHVMKLGASDWQNDKTEMSLALAPTTIPSTATVHLTLNAWFSNGINQNNNDFTIVFGYGRMRYFGSGGGTWQYVSNQNPLTFTNLGSHYMSNNSWHTLSFGYNLQTNSYDSFLIDGVEPFPNLKGIQIMNQRPGAGPYGIWVAPAVNNQSVYWQGTTNGLYAYIDDVAVSLGSTPPTSSTTTSTSTTSTTSTSSTTTTSHTTTTHTSTTTSATSTISTSSTTTIEKITSTTTTTVRTTTTTRATATEIPLNIILIVAVAIAVIAAVLIYWFGRRKVVDQFAALKKKWSRK